MLSKQSDIYFSTLYTETIIETSGASTDECISCVSVPDLYDIQFNLDKEKLYEVYSD